MIKIESLSKSYGPTTAIRNLSLEIPSGEITGLAGPNACGKTTLIKSILGLVKPDSGSLTIDGLYPSDTSSRRLIGYMPQTPRYPDNMCPKELFELLARLRGESSPMLGDLVAQFDLGAHMLVPLSRLSTGTKQKVSAIAALMFNPKLLILDEPTAGFDPIACAVFKRLLAEAANKKTTVLIVSHIVPELEQLAQNLIFMLGGESIFNGPIADLLKQTSAANLESGIVALLKKKEGAK